MARIDVDKILKSLPPLNPEVTDPGVRLPPQQNAVDEFVPPPRQKPLEWFSNRLGKKKSLAVAAELLEKIERIPGTPEEMARYYFDTDLQKLIALGHRHPAEVKTMIERAKSLSPHQRETEPWYLLVQAACGDTRPLFQAFEKMELKKRLALFRITLFSPHVGDGQWMGELFIKLMASTTPEEREKWVEPTLISILRRSAPPASQKVQNKLAWLKALYHGWQREAEELG